MLKITFTKSEGLLRNVDAYFDHQYDKEWFKDPMVKAMVKDIDLSDLLDNGTTISPVLGPIPVSRISGGVKALILALKTDVFIWGTAMGDNCSTWLAEIGKMKDVDICFSHPMKFTTDLDAICIDTSLRHLKTLWMPIIILKVFLFMMILITVKMLTMMTSKGGDTVALYSFKR